MNGLINRFKSIEHTKFELRIISALAKDKLPFVIGELNPEKRKKRKYMILKIFSNTLKSKDA